MQNVKPHEIDRSESLRRADVEPAIGPRALSLDVEVLEERIAPAFLGFGVDTGSGFLPRVWGDDCCN